MLSKAYPGNIKWKHRQQTFPAHGFVTCPPLLAALELHGVGDRILSGELDAVVDKILDLLLVIREVFVPAPEAILAAPGNQVGSLLLTCPLGHQNKPPNPKQKHTHTLPFFDRCIHVHITPRSLTEI